MARFSRDRLTAQGQLIEEMAAVRCVHHEEADALFLLLRQLVGDAGPRNLPM